MGASQQLRLFESYNGHVVIVVALSGICVFITAFVCGLCLVGCIAVRSLTAPQNANNLMNAFIFGLRQIGVSDTLLMKYKARLPSIS